MGNPRGVKRDFVALEKRRFQAVKLFGKSLNNSEIGRRLRGQQPNRQPVAQGIPAGREHGASQRWPSRPLALSG